MTNEEFIAKHRHDNVRALALQRADEGIDLRWCLQQIEGRQRAEDKLPRWAQCEGLWYPPTLSMEQCSSEPTAQYKASIADRLLPQGARHSMADLTGGYGIDFSYLAPLFQCARYVERSEELCRIAQHNFSALDVKGAEVVCADSIEYIAQDATPLDLIYIDPARRDMAGRKTVAMEDCTPDICALQESLLGIAPLVIVKLSPMLDIAVALSRLQHVSEVHTVCVKGECKELLFVLQAGFDGEPQFYAVNATDGSEHIYICTRACRETARPAILQGDACLQGMHLYEPHAGILKAGIQDTLCQRLGVEKLHPTSNLIVSPEPIAACPGRGFKVLSHCGFGKKELRALLANVDSANIAIRNFPTSVADLRKRLRLGEGGDVYLFATTLANGKHTLVRCIKEV